MYGDTCMPITTVTTSQNYLQAILVATILFCYHGESTNSTKVVTTILVEPDILRIGKGGVLQQQQGAVAAVKGSMVLNRPYIYIIKIFYLSINLCIIIKSYYIKQNIIILTNYNN